MHAVTLHEIAGAIDVNWWGLDSNVNKVIPTLMDVMAAHDIRAAFYIEPYVSPDTWRLHANNCTSRNMVFSFQVNPGLDSVVWTIGSIERLTTSRHLRAPPPD